jgi:hypothetical protein
MHTSGMDQDLPKGVKFLVGERNLKTLVFKLVNKDKKIPER